jgi:hypothetical protein
MASFIDFSNFWYKYHVESYAKFKHSPHTAKSTSFESTSSSITPSVRTMAAGQSDYEDELGNFNEIEPAKNPPES